MLRIEALAAHLDQENIITAIPAILAKAGIDTIANMEEAYKNPACEAMLVAMDEAGVFKDNIEENQQLFTNMLATAATPAAEKESENNQPSSPRLFQPAPSASMDEHDQSIRVSENVLGM
jgi:hypothetical protein